MVRTGVALLLALLVVQRATASELRRTAIVRAVQGAKDSVVNIHGQKTVAGDYDQFGVAEPPRQVNGMGTGVIIDPRGYIVTNYHVVQGVRRIQVTMSDGQTHYARIVSYDARVDLAVIKVSSPKPLPVIKIGTSRDLMIGEPVIAMGNAYGYEHTVTRGIVSALHRTVQVTDTQQYEDLIQTDASINPGNSGGPLLNIDGEMVGVNVAVRAGAQGIGFAIAVDKVVQVASNLLSVEKVDHNFHGIVARDASDSQQTGAVVDHLVRGSPGEKGGLQPGDVIVRVDRLAVSRQLDIERALLGRRAGEEVDVFVERNKEQKKLSIVMASEKRGGATIAAGSGEAWDRLGLRLRQVTASELRKHTTRYRGGLMVLDVRPGSPAAEKSIRPGDILVGMHVWETVSLDNVSYVLGRKDLAELGAIKFYIVRGQETLFGHLPASDLVRR
jgi:serine protease Do